MNSDPSRGKVASHWARPLSRIQWMAVLFAVLMAVFFFLATQFPLEANPLAHDSEEYLGISQTLHTSEGGCSFLLRSDLRTYAYPVFLCRLESVARTLAMELRYLVFGVQLALFLAAAMSVFPPLARSWPEAANLAFIGLVINPYALLVTSNVLTESLTSTVILLIASCWLRAAENRSGRRFLLTILVGSLLAGLAPMIRPASLFLVVAWVAGVLVVMPTTWRRQLPVLAVLTSGLLLPMTVQVRNNWINFRKPSPFVVNNLWNYQIEKGAATLKYATAIPAKAGLALPDPEFGKVYYINPLFPSSRDATGQMVVPKALAVIDWGKRFPGRVILTGLLHIFGLIDQDLPLVFNKDLAPWYRLPASLINHLIIGLAAIGVAVWIRAARESVSVRRALLIVAVYAAAHLSMHVFTSPEARFGIPLLLLAVPLALVGARNVFCDSRPAQRWRMTAAVLVYAGCALLLSNWIRAQSPMIAAAESATAAPDVPGRYFR